MRFAPTSSEALLWSAIRAGRLGVAFRRQVPIGAFIVDFLAPAQYLVVEVDGGYHARRRAADARRDRFLAREGYRVLRLESELVLRNPPEAVARVRAALAAGG
jgi:very-short-patch-repair endonuclease